MQQDVVSLPARRFQAILRKWNGAPGGAGSARLGRRADAWIRAPAAIYEVWMSQAARRRCFGRIGRRARSAPWCSKCSSAAPDGQALAAIARRRAGRRSASDLGPTAPAGRWGRLHEIYFRHRSTGPNSTAAPSSGRATPIPSTPPAGPVSARPAGASYRQIIDLADWDRSVMTNVPGESGDPTARHYADLLEEWAEGRYHPMVFSRRAVEARHARTDHADAQRRQRHREARRRVRQIVIAAVDRGGGDQDGHHQQQPPHPRMLR